MPSTLTRVSRLGRVTAQPALVECARGAIETKQATRKDSLGLHTSNRSDSTLDRRSLRMAEQLRFPNTQSFAKHKRFSK